jgi:uncharacterized protein YdaU (DUF1376 family)
MSERPFMQLYVSDFVGDTLLLSTEHIGAYLLLLIALWNADGVLPADDVKLARVARMTVKKWKSVSSEILPFFCVEDGVLTHNRLTNELHKSERQSELRAAAGSRGGAATALKNKGSKPAFAKAKGAARPQHLPEPYKKEGNLDLEGGVQTDGLVVLDRWADEDLFHACEAVTGETVPQYLQKKPFPAEIVIQARAAVEGKTDMGQSRGAA